jgi:hypothetical protein
MPSGGTNATITNSYGYNVATKTLTGVTNAYAYNGEAPSGAATTNGIFRGANASHTAVFTVDGLGNVASTGLNVGLGTSSQTAIIQSAAGPSVPVFEVQNSTSVNVFSVDQNFNTNMRVLGGLGAAPGVSCGAGAGTSPTCPATTTGSDIGGTVAITTGSTPTGSGATIITVTFANTHTAKPGNCSLNPASGTTNALGAATQAYINATTVTTMGFQIISGGTGLAAATTYQWGYTCGG